MNFDIYGPFRLPTTNARLIDDSLSARSTFWEMVEDRYTGLRGACGVYVYCVLARRGALPWYVGLAEKQSFDKRADRHAKLYDRALITPEGKIKTGVSPNLFLIPLHTESTWRFAKPTSQKRGRPAIQFLENYLIGLALERNPNLLNTRQTKFLKSMYVPGLLNSGCGKPSHEAAQLKRVFAA